MQVIHYRQSGKISARNSGSTVLLLVNCTIELPAASENGKGLYFFIPVGDVEATLSCHGNDRIDGQSSVVIRGQKIHGIYSLGDHYIADFEIAPAVPVAVEPEAEIQTA